MASLDRRMSLSPTQKAAQTTDLSKLSFSQILDLFPKAPTSDVASDDKQPSQIANLVASNKKPQRYSMLISRSGSTKLQDGKRSPMLTKQTSMVAPKVTLSGDSGSNLQLQSDTSSVKSANSASPTKLSTFSINDVSGEDALSYTVPSGLATRDYVDLLKRASKGVIATNEKVYLDQFLLALAPSKVLKLQRAVQELLADPKVSPVRSTSLSANLMRGQSSLLNCIDLDKSNLSFGLKGKHLRINQEVSETIKVDYLSGKGGKLTVKLPDARAGYVLICEPNLLKMKAKEKAQLIFKLVVTRPVVLAEVITLEVEGGNCMFLTLNLSSEWSNFGASFQDLQVKFVEHAILPGHTHRVPNVLVSLRQMLLDRNGLLSQDIFRRQIDEETVMVNRANFDSQTRLQELDAESVANLIKIWLRELPERLVNCAPNEIMACEGVEGALKLMNLVQGEGQSTLMWLLDLMCEVLKYKEQNRMSAKKLAIVLSPNVFTQVGVTLSADYFRKTAEVLTIWIEDRLKKVAM